MLVHRNRTRTRQAQHLLEGLNNTGTMVVGTVVNDF
jgi:hypothetical protein